MSFANEFFQDNPVSGELDKISNYQYVIAYTKVPLLKDLSVLNSISGILVTLITKCLDEEQIYAADNLKVEVDPDRGMLITFSDDVYHFALQMDSDSFVFMRNGGPLREFFDFGEVLFDHLPEWFEAVSTFLNNLSEAGGPQFHFSPHYCGYTFEFKIRNFAPAGKSTRDSIPNYELMERIVPSAQTMTTPLSGIGYETRGRTDLKVSGTIKAGPVDWLCWTNIEAPGNKNYSTMNLMFQATSALHDYLDGRKPFNPESLDQWRKISIQLLKDRFFNQFLKNWFGDVKFESIER